MDQYDKKETITEACLQRSKTIESGPEECPARVQGSDWWALLVVTLVFLAMTFLGYLG